MKSIFTLLLSLILSSAYSQKDYSFVYHTDSIIQKGVRLHDKQKYDDAIKEYNRIAITDPKYLFAQYEKALSLSAADKKEELTAHLETFHKRMPEYPGLYIIYGVFLSDEKKFDESEKIFNEGEKYLNNSASFYYNLGILHLRKEDRQKSVDAFKKALYINPNLASAHYFLGLIALEDGQVSQGAIGLMSYLMLDPTAKFAENAVIKLNQKFGENFLDKPKLKLSDSGDNFTDLDEILRNQLALKKAYKLKSELDETVIRQMQAVAEYASTHNSEDGFFETTYLPWIKVMYDKKHFEGFSYYSLLSMEAKLGKKLTSQKKKTIAFYNTFVKNDFWDLYAKRKMDIFGEQKDVVVYLQNGDPYFMGETKSGKKEGKFKVLGDFGILSAEINYKNDELDGIQKYYDQNGNLTEEKTFLNGKLNGIRKKYYANGLLSMVENYKDDKLNGISTSYHVNGGKNCELNYVDGESHGTLICLFPNGSKQSELTYKNGKLDGNATYYNIVGDIVSKYEFKDDERHGKSIQYYDGKVVKSEGEYANGKGLGTYKYFYANGTPESEIFYVNGKISKKIFYYANQLKWMEENYDDKEIMEGIAYFDHNGDKYFEEKFKNGEFKSGIQYGKLMAKPIETSVSKKKFAMNNFDGKLMIDGAMDKGKNIGEWNYRYSSGVVSSKKNFVAGEQKGISIQYHRNGEVSRIANYHSNKLHGRYEEYDFGVLKSVSNYSNNVQQGPYHTFNPDGTLSVEGFVLDDEISGLVFNYWRNQNLMIKTTFIEDEITKSEFFDIDGKPEAELDLKNLNGAVVVKLRSGNTIEKRNYTNGKLNGNYSVQDKSGDLISDMNFTNGSRNGLCKFYSPSGKLLLESTYYAGNYHGTNKWYDLVGNLRTTTDHVYGTDTGKTTRYFHNKNKMWEYNEINAIKEGEYQFYNQKGETILVINYKNNTPVSYKTLSKDGKLDNPIEIIEENATIVSNYPNDKTAITLQLKNGNFDGKIKIHSVEGVLEFEALYVKSLIEGERNEFYANGKLYKKERFKDGDYNGKTEYFKEDGKPWIVANYSLDQLNGDFLIYNNGTLSKTKKYDSDELIAVSK